jgi:hypothetical protein
MTVVAPPSPASSRVRPSSKTSRAPVCGRYTYLGDKLTDPALLDRECRAVLRPDGKCIVGRGSMLVQFAGESSPRVVLRRRLRKLPPAMAF